MILKKTLGPLLIVAVISVLSLTSCDPAKKYEKQEQNQIDQYLTENPGLQFEQKASGLYYLDVQVGTGTDALIHDTAYVKYTGKLLDGTIFDTNVGKPDTLIVPVGEGWLISGFDEGLTYMKQGGKAMFLIPSSLAYGPSGYYAIQGYTPLLFDVEMVKVKKGQAGVK